MCTIHKRNTVLQYATILYEYYIKRGVVHTHAGAQSPDIPIKERLAPKLAGNPSRVISWLGAKPSGSRARSRSGGASQLYSEKVPGPGLTVNFQA